MNKNDQEFLVQKIRTQYTEKEHTELDELKELDKKVKRPANVFAYVFGSVLMLVSVLLVVLVLFQSSKKHGLSGAIGGTTGDSYFGKNQGQTKEKKLSRLTTIACAVFAVVAIAAYIICS